MRTLQVLGGLWLNDGTGPSSGRGAQRRRLALLSLLALSPGRRVTRDKAIATLWPENTSAEGRRRLSSAVYDLRGLLGDDAIESAGDELWIAPTAALRIDVDDFEAAFARGDAEAAVASYGGPLLDGVHLSGAHEFEEWIASQRERVRRQYLQALEHVASARTSHGDHAGAVSAALRLVDLEPLSGNAALVAVNALVAAGDRPRALNVADTHAARVRRDLGLEPDDAIVDVVRRLRATSRPSNHSFPRADEAEGTAESALVGAADAGTTEQIPGASGDARASRRFSVILLRGAVAAGIVVVALAGAAYRSRASAARRESAGNVIPMGLAAAAASSTKSPAALESFIEGEAAYEHGGYDAAKKHFLAAVAQDPTFALAHYRLSESMLWEEDPMDYASVQDSLALAWSSNLPDEERLLIRGYLAWRQGDYELADSLDRVVIRLDPRSAEADFQLGEVGFHYNPLRGRPGDQGAAWFLRALTVDSANWGARWHILLLEASHIGDVEFRERVQQLLAAGPDGHLAAELELFAADSAALPGVATKATESMLYDAAWRRAVYRRDLNGAEMLLRRAIAVHGPESNAMATSIGLEALRLGRGRVRDALQVLELPAAKRNDGGAAWVVFVHGLLANRSDTSIRLDTLDRPIDRWRETLSEFYPPSGVPRAVALYLDGLIAVSRGDSTAALHAAAELDEIASRGAPYVPAWHRSPRELAHTVRAYAAWRGGRCDAALRELDEEKGRYWLGIIASTPVAAQSLERYVRGECLLSLGKYADAIQWFETLEQGTLYDLEFLGASLRGQAAAHRAMGDTAAAAVIEQRLADLQAK